MKFKYLALFLIFLTLSSWVVSQVAFGQLAEKTLPASKEDYNPDSYKESPRFYVYKPDANIKVDENRFKAGLLFDVENRKIVWQKDMSSVYPIASLTKMMVALLAVEDVHAGKIHWDDQVQWTREYISWNKRKCVRSYSPASYNLYELFKNAMIASNNESAEQMARYLGKGDLDAVIQRMNLRARELGMNATYYGNPTGLPARSRMYDNASCPSDLLLLTIEMLKHPEITQVTGMDYAAITQVGGKNASLISNHNHLAIDFKGEVDGMKTGYTRRAGFCLVATSNKCGHRLVSIVLGARAPITRNEIVKNMFNDYYLSIGSDPLAPHCLNPQVYATAGSADEDGSQDEGEYAYKTKVVFKPYTVNKGERLATIASKFSCSTSELRGWNHLKKSGVRPGQRLVVRTTVKEKVWVTKQDEAIITHEETSAPVIASENVNAKDSDANVVPENQTTAAVVEEKKIVEEKKEVKAVRPVKAKKANTVKRNSIELPSADKFVYHTVQRGDTLFKIAQRYKGASVKQLKQLNNLSNASSLKPGMKIKIPSAS